MLCYFCVTDTRIADIAVEWLAFLLHILKVSRSGLGPETGYLV
jgi:hypothetical protein